MELSEPLLDEAGERSEYLRPRDFVALAERYLTEEPGVTREQFSAHVEALAEESHVEAASFEAALKDVLTDADGWADDQAVYTLSGDRLSAYPPAWHEALSGTRSLPEVVRYLIEESDYRRVDAGPGDGVPEEDLLDIAAAVADFTREEAIAAIETCRDEGTLVEDVDQHPESGVYLPESGVQQDPDAKQ
jgi:hypothetical protein